MGDESFRPGIYVTRESVDGKITHVLARGNIPGYTPEALDDLARDICGGVISVAEAEQRYKDLRIVDNLIERVTKRRK